ncbi:MAG TPA: PilZ domain-containing protein [Vicinamibacteria bacterium]|nr:PilZ domain-containing protein [Vicinamibacteria bacterium]
MTELKDAFRRRAVRFPLAIQGQLSGRRQAAWDVGVVDVSLSGCLVRCPSSLDRGEILDLRLPLGEGGLSAKVQVADSSIDGAASPGEPTYLVGLRFFGLPARDEARLRVFLDERRRSAPLG